MGITKRCDIEETELVNEQGRSIPGVVATCQGCGAAVEAFGTTERSLKRCMVLMRNNCHCHDSGDAFFMCDDLEE